MRRRSLEGAGSRSGWRASTASSAVAAVCALALVAAGCGSRRSAEDIAAAAGAVPPGAALTVVTDTDADGAPAPVAQGTEAGTATDGSQSAGTPAAGVAAAGAPRGASSPGAASRSGGPATGAAASGTTAAKAPVRIGVVGTMSGVGGTQLGSTKAVQAWAQARNRAGGIDGHPIEVIVVDDGGDPARFRAALQDLVERRGVIAFVGALTGFSLSEGAVRYLEEKKVPIVGGDRLSAMWNTSPMLFPQASAGDAVIWNHSVNTVRIAGKGTAVGWVACQEAQICKDADRLWQQYLPALGMETKYRSTVSVAQPSFTAECASAQQNGVKVFLLGTDANSTRRIANDCAKQGYRPRFAVLQTSDEMAAEPALEGGFFGSATFPWVVGDTPATKEFRDTMATYAPGVDLSAHSSSGWVAAKLFQTAVTGRLGDTPTASQVLEGLWALRGETLGGLTSAITFSRGKGAPPSYCFFPMIIAGEKWTASPREQVCRAPG